MNKRRMKVTKNLWTLINESISRRRLRRKTRKQIMVDEGSSSASDSTANVYVSHNYGRFAHDNSEDEMDNDESDEESVDSN